jgi:peptidoglycan/xylan/chitin deacetylase (PgdA/CDA1 family)
MRAGLLPSSLNPRQLLRHGMAMTLPRRMFMVSGPKDSRRVALTFDDGPHPLHTPVLLDRLGALGIRATFFLLGRQAERHPDIVRRIAAEGHDVGHHSYTHGDPAATSSSALLSEVWRATRLLEPLTGRAPRLFRPPHGKITGSKCLRLWAAGQTVVLWNQDPKDFACDSADTLRAWFATQQLSAGDVILLHDVHPHAAAALEAIAARVRGAGLDFCRVSDWVGGG